MKERRCILPNRLYEVTLTTRQNRYFFIPIKSLTLLIIGVLAYCQRKYELGICAVVFLTNHAHLLIRADSADQARSFFCLANSQIAQEVQKVCDWDGGIFKNMDITPVTDEPEAQVERLRYILSQGVKEGLVPHPSKWPGVHFAKALLTGSMKMKGLWIHRTGLWQRIPSRKRRKGATRRWLSKTDYEACQEHLTLELAPLPCWDHLEPADRVEKARSLCREIQAENTVIRSNVPRNYRKRLVDRSLFTYRPPKDKFKEKERNRPKVHAATLETWQCWVDDLKTWQDDYQRASDRLRRGILEALKEFPEQAFLPTGILTRGEGLPPPEATPGSRMK